LAGLAELAPDIPVLSEESDELPWSERKAWDRYFLIDPLDGTKEFINRNGEFTVNVALIENHTPVMGVVHVPVKNILYAGIGGPEPSAFVERGGEREIIRTRPLDRQHLTVVASRRHGGDALKGCLEKLAAHFPDIDTRNMGSSLKLCLVAEGQADLYPRLAPTSEWDTAAAQAVVEAAGGMVVDTAFSPVRYNAKEDILNPHFYVLGDPAFDWQRILG
ncbi:MAG: 3'(2'),5'-bisphosphate nucleotidase CysQ, partial [Pseudomonadales bacterium]|nr:3'(2'),5'-bisphosphate nucleotidase CysQ [Pseudomonadales bacterium]